MRAVYPGSFDPATPGHLAVARRAARLFDELVLCVLTNPNKSGRLDPSERMALLAELTDELANVSVDASPDQLLVDYCRANHIDVIVRGLRSPSDLASELPMAQLNRRVDGLETLFLPSDPAEAHFSSTLVTTVAELG